MKKYYIILILVFIHLHAYSEKNVNTQHSELVEWLSGRSLLQTLRIYELDKSKISSYGVKNDITISFYLYLSEIYEKDAPSIVIKDAIITFYGAIDKTNNSQFKEYFNDPLEWRKGEEPGRKPNDKIFKFKSHDEYIKALNGFHDFLEHKSS